MEASTLFMTGNSYCIYIITTISMPCHMCLFLEKKIRIKIYYKSKVAKCNVNIIHSFFYKNTVYKNTEAEIWYQFFQKMGKYSPITKENYVR